MAKAKIMAAQKPNLRGSPEAVKKRVAARNLNDVLSGKKTGFPVLDGRTEKRRQRLLGEVVQEALKPVDLLLKVQELFDLGESYISLRKLIPARRLRAVPEGAAEALATMMEAYTLSEDVYRFLGLPEAVLKEAGAIQQQAAKKSLTPKKRSAGSKSRTEASKAEPTGA